MLEALDLGARRVDDGGGIAEPADTARERSALVFALVVDVAFFVGGEAHLQASWIFTANDLEVNVLVIVAAIGVVLTGSAVPDLIAGAIIFVVVADGGRTILELSR